MSPNVVRDTAEHKSNSPAHAPGPAGRRSCCQVCRLEANISNSEELKRFSKRNCLVCMDLSCGIAAHNHVLASLKPHELIGPGQTCFDIAHSEQGQRTWEPDARGSKTVPCEIEMANPVVQAVRAHHGLNPTKIGKNTGNGSNNS